MTSHCFFVLSFAVLLSCGCADSNPAGRLPISGEVTLAGQPLPKGTIEFAPIDAGLSSGAQIEDGKYSIETARGLPPGDYTVRISATDEQSEPIEMPGEFTKLAKELIPPEYGSASTLKFTVVAGQDNRFDVKIPEAAN